MNNLERFREAVDNRHEYAKRWKTKTGARALGYICTYFPEEIVYAAGMLPVRVISDRQPASVSDMHMSAQKWCPFSRACLSEALEGDYDYLDGIAVAACCFHNLQTFGSWRKGLSTGYSHYLYVPAHLQGANARSCLAAELGNLKQSLESWIGRSISNNDLDRSISAYNENRRLLHSIYELRKQEPPLVSGPEAMEMVLSSQLMDKEEHNALLREALKTLAAQEPRLKAAPRLMVVGSGANDLELVGAIESWGGNIVADDHCIGSRYFWNEVKPGEDRLAAIADRYIQRPPCPSKDFPKRNRLSHLLDLVDTYNVQGVILLLQNRCEPHSYDIPVIESKLGEMNIPSIVLDISTPPALGQMQNRVESLLDIIRDQIGDY